MTLAHLIKVVKLYLQSDFPTVENHPLLSQGDGVATNAVIEDLIVTAANSARKWAEMRHDFRCASVKLPVIIPAEGEVALDDVNGVSLKTISHCYFTDSLTPVSMITDKADWYRRYEQQDQLPSGHRSYLTDHNKHYLAPALLYVNNSLTTSGSYDEEVKIDVHGYRWMPDYEIESVTPAQLICPGSTLIMNLNGSDEWPSGIAQVTLKTDLYDDNYNLQFPAGTYDVDNQSGGTILVFDQTFTDPAFSQVVPVFYNQPATNSSDWFLKHGFEYMQWATIVEVNHLLQTFVPRQEGSLSPPEKMRDRAFEAIRALDVWTSEGGVYYEL